MLRILILILTFIISSEVCCQSNDIWLHSHNDYEQKHPLVEAIKLGYHIIEVDIMNNGDQLVVCHDRDDASKAKSLEELYLKPISLYPRQEITNLHLMLDIKERDDGNIDLLLRTLEPYKDLYLPDSLGRSVIKIILSGAIDRNQNALSTYPPGILLDGRATNIHNDVSKDIMPIISVDIKKLSKWNGKNRIPRSDALIIQHFIKQVHSKGFLIRFWNVADKEHAWSTLIGLGADIIGTDHLKKLRNYIDKS